MDTTNAVGFLGILKGVLVCLSDAVTKHCDQKPIMVEKGVPGHNPSLRAVSQGKN